MWPNAEGLVAVIYEAYLDYSETYSEAGKPQGHAHTLSCLVASSEQWEAFDLAWKAAMKCGGAEGKILHMKELMAGVDQFEGWEGPQKNRLIRKLIPTLESGIKFGFCGSIPVGTFEEVHEPLREHPNDGPRIHQVGLQGAMGTIREMIQPTEANPVVFFVEKDQAIEHDIFVQFYSATRQMDWEKLFPTIVPLPKGPTPLQAADLVAWEGSTYASRHVFGESARLPRKSFLALESFPHFQFFRADHQMILTHAVTRFLAESTGLGDPSFKRKWDGIYKGSRRQTQRQRSGPRLPRGSK